MGEKFVKIKAERAEFDAIMKGPKEALNAAQKAVDGVYHARNVESILKNIDDFRERVVKGYFCGIVLIGVSTEAQQGTVDSPKFYSAQLLEQVSRIQHQLLCES